MSVEYYRLEIRTEAPLILGTFDIATGNINDLERYISGPRLRGAMARALLEADTDKSVVEELLGSQERTGLRFPPCFPVPGCFVESHKAAAEGLKQADDFPFPAPASLRRCKREKTEHHAIDLSLAQGIFFRSGSPLPFDLRCGAEIKEASNSEDGTPRDGARPGKKAQLKDGESRICSEALTGLDSILRRVEIECETAKVFWRGYECNDVYPHAQTHVGIDRYRHASADGFLFTLQAYDLGLVFVGHLALPVELEQKARQAFEAIRLIGGGTSRGFGQVRVRLDRLKRLNGGSEKTKSSKSSSLEQRIDALNTRAEAVADGLHALNVKPVVTGGCFLTLDLLSDAELLDAEGFPTARLNPEMLANRLIALGAEPTALEGLEVLEQWTLPRQVGGWHTGWQTPRTLRHLAGAGSSYLLQLPRPASQLSVSLLAAMERLEYEGLGEHLEEGLGHLRWCSPIHSEGEVIKLKDWKT